MAHVVITPHDHALLDALTGDDRELVQSLWPEDVPLPTCGHHPGSDLAASLPSSRFAAYGVSQDDWRQMIEEIREQLLENGRRSLVAALARQAVESAGLAAGRATPEDIEGAALDALFFETNDVLPKELAARDASDRIHNAVGFMGSEFIGTEVMRLTTDMRMWVSAYVNGISRQSALT